MLGLKKWDWNCTEIFSELNVFSWTCGMITLKGVWRVKAAKVNKWGITIYAR